jgi:hypothetical protein
MKKMILMALMLGLFGLTAAGCGGCGCDGGGCDPCGGGSSGYYR